MANVKVSALSSLAAIAEEDTLIVNDYSEAAEKVKAATIPNMRLAMLLPGVDNTNDIGSAIKRIKNVYIAGDVSIGDDLTVTGDITVNSVVQGKDVTAAIHTKIVNIGDWNMDSTSSVSVAHGLTFSKIRGVSVMIRNDDDNQYDQLNNSEGVLTGNFTVIATYVVLYRAGSGGFDAIQYDSTSYNRGWITIWYVD